MINYNTNILNIQDDCIDIVSFKLIGDEYRATLSLSKIDNICCPKCNSKNLHVHARKERIIKHINIGDKPIIISLKYPRLICTDCNKTFNPPLSFVGKNRRLSNELRRVTLNKVSKKISIKDISKESNVSETTVINEIKTELHEHRCQLSEVICIDEFRATTIAGTYALIIGDPITGKILDVLPTRTQDYIIYYLQTINKEEILSVKYVVTDLNEAYRLVIRGFYTNAVHIADRFHVTKLVTNAFNNIRIRRMNYYLELSKKDTTEHKHEYKKYYDLLKKNNKILISNKASHDSWHYDQIVHVDKYGEVTTLNTIIEDCINKDDILEEAYLLLQDFYKWFKYSTHQNAKKNLLAWCEKVNSSELTIPELKKVTLTFKNWMNEIVNSFILNPITHQRMTNGFIEGKNNFVKVIKRIGFGYKDFDLFRLRILKADKNRNK